MYDSISDTLKHIDNVEMFINQIIDELVLRIDRHDRSKLEPPEKEIFDEYTPKLKKTTYGSEEYKRYLKEMQVALDHHYANNRHHPEHFKNHQKQGETWQPLKHMNLIDVIEMLCDWKAATMRHDDGDIRRSLEINEKRFSISPQLMEIFGNTVTNFGW